MFLSHSPQFGGKHARLQSGKHRKSKHHANGKFRNLTSTPLLGPFSDRLKAVFDYIFTKGSRFPESPVPIIPLSEEIILLECGAYSRYWPNIHMLPEDTVQAHLDLKGGVLMPIHWARFNLSLHSWTEPVERLMELGNREGSPAWSI